MGICLVEVRESNKIDNHKIAQAIHDKKFMTKEDLTKGLLEVGLPENKLHLIRVYDINDFVDMSNSGEPFDALAKVEMGVEIGLDNKLVDFG